MLHHRAGRTADRPHDAIPRRVHADDFVRPRRVAEESTIPGPWAGRAATDWRHAAALAAAVLAAHLPAVAMPHLFMDDYSIFYNPDRESAIVEFFVSMGRPLTAVYLLAGDYALDAPYGNELCHLAGIVGAVLLGWATFHWLRRNDAPPFEAAFLSFLIGALPSVQLYVAWTTAGSSTYAACLATLALLVFDQRCEPAAEGRPFPSRRRMIAALALLVVAQLTYQPAALYFWSMSLAGMVIARPRAPRELAMRGASYLLLGCASVVAYLAAFRGMLALTGYPATSRAQFAGLSQLPAKMKWFVSEPLENAACLWSHWPSDELVIAVSSLIVAGLSLRWLHWRQSEQARENSANASRHSALAWSVAVAAIVLAMIPLSYMFNLLVVESWPSYRSIFALAAVCLVLAYAAWDSLAALAGDAWQTRLRRGALIACALIALVSCHWNMIRRMVYPQAVELAYLRSRLNPADLADKTHIHVVRPAWSEGVCPDVRYDEFGLPSTCQPWVPEPMVRMALSQKGLDASRFAITHGPGGEPAPSGPHVAVVDMRKLAQLRTYESWR